MVEIHGRYVYDDSLNPGAAAEGGLSQLLFNDDGKLADHAVFIPDDPSESTSDTANAQWVVIDTSPVDEPVDAKVTVVIIAAIMLAKGAVVAAPHVRVWWTEKFIPRLRGLGRRRRSSTVVAVPAPSLGEVQQDFSDAVDLAVGDLGPAMSQAEAHELLVSMLSAAAFIADQMRTLNDATIVVDVDLTGLRAGMEKLTTGAVTDQVNLVLEANPELLKAATGDKFLRVFGGGQIVNGVYTPIRNEQVRRALSIDASESNTTD